MYDSETIHNLMKQRVRFSSKHEAIFDYDTGIGYTYGDMEARSDKLAHFLVNVLGLQKGDRIGFCAVNHVGMFDAFFTTFKTGIIITTYNCLLKETELLALIDNEAPKVIFYSREVAAGAEAMKMLGFPQEFICLDDIESDDRYGYSDIMSLTEYTVPTPPEMDYEDIQMLIHTGGTTGTPKAAKLSFRSIFYNQLVEHLYLQVTEDDTALQMLPLFHTAGWNVVCLPTLAGGGRLILTRSFAPDNLLEIMKKERPTIGISVETIFKAISNHPDFPEADLSSYRFLLVGAAPTGKELLERYWNKGVKMVNSYGMTEIGPNNMSHPIGMMSIDDIRQKWNSCGKPAPFNDFRLLGDDGNEVAPGEKGELVFRGKLLFSGYWNNPEATERIFDNGWVHTGDVGYLDEDGFCYICGRKKSMFISGGENIFTQEICDVISTLDGIDDVYIVGVPDEKWGEVGHALVVLTKGSSVSADEIKKKVKHDLSTIKVPKYITFLDAIPKNAVGKSDLVKIKELYGKVPEQA